MPKDCCLLKTSVRRETLVRLGTRTRMLETLAAFPDRPADEFEPELRFPFVYLPLDNPVLRVEEPFTLLTEAVRQLRLDLIQLNGQGPLADGSVPLLQWLNSAAALAAGTTEQRQFLAAADEISHRVTGSPKVDLTSLPEYKEQIIHQDDMVSHAFLRQALEASRAVARLRVRRHENGAEVQRGGKPVIYLGTGWLIAQTLLMTNHHVINARGEDEAAASGQDFERQGAATAVQFDFDAPAQEGIMVGVASLRVADPDLDYAILRLEPTNRQPLAVCPVPLRMKIGNDTPVNIIQHPNGENKRYAIRNNLVSAATEREVRSFTDTQGGSSGSPVLNDDWKVVALHRGSSFADGVKFQGRSTAYVNLGTAIHAILADLRARDAALAEELSLWMGKSKN